MASKLILTLSATSLAISSAVFAADNVPALRVCADPGNMPLSNTQSEGFHNKIAEVLAQAMGTHVTYAYRPYLERGLTRQTFKNNRCDILMDMSADNERMITTTPLYRSTFVLATKADSPYKFSSFADPELKELTIGVFQHSAIRTELMEHGINGNNLRLHIISHNADLKPERQPTKQVEAVINGDLDIAGAWGPLAGWYNAGDTKPLTLYPLNQYDTVLPMEFELGIGLKKSDTQLRDKLNQVLIQEKEKIKEILVSYGVPLVECSNCIVSGDIPSHGPYQQHEHVVAKYQTAKQSNKDELPEQIDAALQAGSTLDGELLNAVLAKDLPRVSYVIERGADINTPDANGLTPLMNAVKGANLDLVKLLLKNKAEPNAIDSDGWTAAMHAAWLNEPKMIRTLSAYGTDFEKVEKLTQSTALSLAVQNGKALAVVALLDSGADANLAVGEANYTPLMIAAKVGKLPVAQTLVQYGANPNLTNDGGVTALMIAAANNNPDIISLLIKSGADPELKNAKGQTAYEIAHQREAKDAIHMFHRFNINKLSIATQNNKLSIES
ncbi:MAG: quinoprotein dehydrogenase-associated putative ABC transporter substrate-binding protein [Gammaproteobacteria bacterium]|nr:quinoprotein dehydrogenase-associated putative ABC transporter substrate-binding protein [Gammaproteobacteria bacterium]